MHSCVHAHAWYRRYPACSIVKCSEACSNQVESAPHFLACPAGVQSLPLLHSLVFLLKLPVMCCAALLQAMLCDDFCLQSVMSILFPCVSSPQLVQSTHAQHHPLHKGTKLLHDPVLVRPGWCRLCGRAFISKHGFASVAVRLKWQSHMAWSHVQGDE